MKLEEAKNRIRKQLPNLKKKYHVNRLGVFGSVAKGCAKKNSDFDILVEFLSPIGFIDFIRLENELSKVLHKKADLLSRKAIKPSIKKSILDEVMYV